MSHSSLILIHQPFGEQHPYIPLPCERQPRDPAAGEPVTLGIQTTGQPQADAVWCAWQVQGSPDVHRVEAQRTGGDETTGQWQAHLPAFQGGETVRYRLHARNAQEEVQSQEFTFGVSSWVECTFLAAVEENAEKLVLRLATTRPGLFVRLTAEPDSNGTLFLRLSAFYDPSHTPSPVAGARAAWAGLRLSLEGSPARLCLQRQEDGLALRAAHPIGVRTAADGSLQQMRLGFESPAGEAFYGFGERFNALDQRGNTLDNRVYGQYTGQGKRSYIPMPFFLSSRGYGLWLKTDRQAWFDMACSRGDCWTVSGEVEEDGSLEVAVFLQPAPRGIVQAFSACTGKAELPPPWVFGLWMSSNDWNSQAEVLRQVRLTEEHAIPATVLVSEAWSDEIKFYIWNDAQNPIRPSSQAYTLEDFTFPPQGRWPDPKAMVEELHRAGLRLVLWQNPLLKQNKPDEPFDDTLNQADQAYAIQQGYVVTKEDGTPHRVEAHMPWFGDSLVLDFTHPQATEWWFSKRRYLVTELGVDGFKTDGGEHVWDTATRFHNGMRGSRGINHYPLAYQAAYRRFMQSLRGEDHVLFSRAGYSGAQCNPAHWAGDENSTWEAYRATLRAMLNVGLCGVPFFGWDIAGFAGPLPSAELYLRATAFSTFCPIMQYHSDVNHQRKPSRDRTPWNMQEQSGDPGVIDTFRFFANLRMNLLPYILCQAQESSRSGLPLMRALPLEFPGDDACRSYPYEYLFGDALLVAPVTEEGRSTWTVYLPAGEWRDFWTGEVRCGPAEIEVPAPRGRIPVYQRRGSLVALHLDESGELGSPVGNRTDRFDRLTLRIFPGGRGEFPLYLPGQEAPRHVFVHALDGELDIQLPHLEQGADLVVCTRQPAALQVNGHPVPYVDGESLTCGEVCWAWNEGRGEVRLHLPAPASACRVTAS